jgi:hypothetical protein
VVWREESNGQLQPIVGEPPVNARLDVADIDSKAVLEPVEFLRADPAASQRVGSCGFR